MRTNSIAIGGVCDPKRLALSAQRFVDLQGTDGLTAFLRATAGVSIIEDVPPDDRFRVNRALRDEINAASPRDAMMARVRSVAFGKLRR